MTRYIPTADRLAVRRIRRLEVKGLPKARSSSVRSAIRESLGS